MKLARDLVISQSLAHKEKDELKYEGVGEGRESAIEGLAGHAEELSEKKKVYFGKSFLCGGYIQGKLYWEMEIVH